MYYIAICDDNSDFIRYMKNMLLKSGLKNEEVFFYEYNSGEELIKSINTCDKIY